MRRAFVYRAPREVVARRRRVSVEWEVRHPPGMQTARGADRRQTPANSARQGAGGTALQATHGSATAFRSLFQRKRRGKLIERRIQLALHKRDDMPLEEDKHHQSGKLNRENDDDDCDSEQPEPQRVPYQPSTLRKYPWPRRVAMTSEPILRRSRPSNASRTLASLSLSCP